MTLEELERLEELARQHTSRFPIFDLIAMAKWALQAKTRLEFVAACKVPHQCKCRPCQDAIKAALSAFPCGAKP